MILNENLRKRRDCLEECARRDDRCKTGQTLQEDDNPCQERFEKCTTLCKFDYE